MMTNDTLDQHRPTEAFRDYLESEVVRQLRRGRTFRRLRAAAVIIVSVGIGATATLASAQVREDARKDSVREAAKADLMIASLRLGLARTEYAEAQKQFSLGVRPAGSLAQTELQLKAAEHLVAMTILNGRETDATGLPPRDDLNAPLVRGTDFVKQRLRARAMMAERQLQVAESVRDDARRREALGIVMKAEVAEQELAVLKARAALVGIAERMKARDEFLEKGTPLGELMRRVERIETQQAVIVANQSLEVAQAALVHAEQRRAAGVSTDVEVLRARLDVAERQVELQRAMRRLEQIR